MSTLCPDCGGKGVITADCPYCRDCDSFEHSELAEKTCLGCGDTGCLETICPACKGK